MAQPRKLHPSQFKVDQAWIAFQLNDEPVQTNQDGSFNVMSLMDAASCYIFGTAFVPIDKTGMTDVSEVDARRLLQAGWQHHKRFPSILYLPREQAHTTFAAEAERQMISIVRVPEKQLLPFIGEARAGFSERFGSHRL